MRPSSRRRRDARTSATRSPAFSSTVAHPHAPAIGSDHRLRHHRRTGFARPAASRASDIDTKTPYNTYQIDGLPPGPICNPGRSAIEATLDPAKTTDLYFVADGTGGHTFSASLKDHNSAVQTWRSSNVKQRPSRPSSRRPSPCPLPAKYRRRGRCPSAPPSRFHCLCASPSTDRSRASPVETYPRNR